MPGDGPESAHWGSKLGAVNVGKLKVFFSQAPHRRPRRMRLLSLLALADICFLSAPLLVACEDAPKSQQWTISGPSGGGATAAAAAAARKGGDNRSELLGQTVEGMHAAATYIRPSRSSNSSSTDFKSTLDQSGGGGEGADTSGGMGSGASARLERAPCSFGGQDRMFAKSLDCSGRRDLEAPHLKVGSAPPACDMIYKAASLLGASAPSPGRHILSAFSYSYHSEAVRGVTELQDPPSCARPGTPLVKLRLRHGLVVQLRVHATGDEDGLCS